MKKKAKIISLLLVLAMTISLVAGCGQQKPPQGSEQPTGQSSTPKPTSSQQPTEVKEIVFWHHEAPEERVNTFQEIIDDFNAANPQYNVRQEVVMWGDAWVKTATAISSGTAPDFQFGIPDLMLTAYKNDGIIPVTDLVKELDQKHDFYQSQLDIYFYNNEYWGIPIFTMLWGVCYRPSIVEKYLGHTNPPETWDNLLNYAKTITEKSNKEVYGMGLSSAKNLMADESFYAVMASSGSMPFDENGNVIFNSQETIDALKFYKELCKYSPPGHEAWSWGELQTNQTVGTVAMTISDLQLEVNLDEMGSSDYGVWPMPLKKKGAKPGTMTYPNEISVFKAAKDRGNLDGVYDFVRFVLEPEHNSKLIEMCAGSFLPVTKTCAESKELWEKPRMKRFEEANRTAIGFLEYATLYGFEHGKWVNLGIGDYVGANLFSDTMSKVVSEQMTPEEAAAWAQGEMEKLSVPIK